MSYLCWQLLLLLLSSCDTYDMINTAPPPPHFSTKKKITHQPITAAVIVSLVNKKDCDWLIGSFLFGAEIEGGGAAK